MSNFEETINGVEELTIKRSAGNGQYYIEVNSRVILLPRVTNFEWRMDKPAGITHLYLGNETTEKVGYELRVTFDKPYTIEISSPDARCYIRIDKQKPAFEE
jgi:hypothetical protein